MSCSRVMRIFFLCKGKVCWKASQNNVVLWELAFMGPKNSCSFQQFQYKVLYQVPNYSHRYFFAGYGKRIINWYGNSLVNRSDAFIWRLKKYWLGKFVIMWLFVWTLTNTWIRKAGSLGKIISFISQPHSLKICRSNVFI